jgi:NitT/TauT family transport system substrate-binding protein
VTTTSNVPTGAAMSIDQSRRRFLSQLGIAGVASMGGLASAGLYSGSRSFAAEPPPEITTVTLEKIPGTCTAPQFIAEALLRAEGFTDVRYRARDTDPVTEVTSKQIDWSQAVAADAIADMDNGAPLTMVAGVHPGCYELIAHDYVRSITGLRGKTVGWSRGYVSSRYLVSLMAKFVGLDPHNDIRWVEDTGTDPMTLFVDRKIDAFLTSMPQSLELHDRGIGHTLVNSVTDRPWSQYFCCMLVGRTEFVQNYPFATKRIVRAWLKAVDLCASEPERMARLIVDKGFTPRYDYALQTLQELPYGVWRDFDPEDTVRFFALRLNEAGYIKSTPDRIITEHTNWRFINELKRELKT